MRTDKWPDFKGIISDLDGVAYEGDRPIASAVRAFARWRALGIPYAFVTNNSSKSSDEIAEKLTNMGIQSDTHQVISTAHVTADMLGKFVQPGARVFVIGAKSLKDAIAAFGYVIETSRVDAVVVGIDREFTYEKLAIAQREILAGAQLIGTNPDLKIPTEIGMAPGAGTLIRAVEAATGKTAFIVGKPNRYLVDIALSVLKTSAQDTILVGDQLDTDIASGQAAGVVPVLVRTGVDKDAYAENAPWFSVPTLLDIPLRLQTN